MLFCDALVSSMQFVYAGALNSEVFAQVAVVYQQLKATMGLDGIAVPVQMAEDETKIDPSVEFDLATHSLVGFCGDIDPNHKCSVHGAHVKLPRDPPDGELTFIWTQFHAFVGLSYSFS
jgi:hypothetical protein